MSDTQDRLDQYLAAKNAGADERTATIGAFPEYSPEMMSSQIPEMIKAPVNTPLTDMRANKASEEISRQGMVLNFMQQGLNEFEANLLFKEVFTGLPDGEQPADYDRLDRMLSSGRSRAAASDVERFNTIGELVSDVEFAAAALQGSFGGFQQAFFGILAGEKAGDIVDSLWPDVDIRDDEGVMRSKAVVPIAARAAGLGALKLAIKSLTFGKLGVPDTIDNQLDEDKLALVETDYMEGLLTGSEVIEYWMNGDGIVGARLPERGTPEREAYDEQVRANAAEMYNGMMNEPGGVGHLAAIATGGALMDILVDPLVFVSEVPVKAFDVARRLAPASSRARVTAGVAERTGRLPEVLDALNNAEEWLTKSKVKYDADPSKANKGRLQHAEKMVVRMRNRATKAQAPGEQVLLRTHPRLDPDHAKLIGREYLGADVKNRRHVTEQFINKQINDYEVATIDQWNDIVKQIEDAEEIGGQEELIANLEEQLRILQKPADQWQETMKWFKERMKAESGSRTAAFFKESISKQQPYQSGHILPEIVDGSGFAPVSPEPGLIDRAFSERLGPGAASGLPKLLDRIVSAVANVESADTIIPLMDDFFSTFGAMLKSEGFDPLLRSKASTLARTGMTEAEYTEAFNKAVSQWSNEWGKALSSRRDDDPLAKMATGIINDFHSRDVDSLLDRLLDIDEQLRNIKPQDGDFWDSGLQARPLKSMQGEGKNLDGAGPTKPTAATNAWDMSRDVYLAHFDKARVVDRTKEQALKLVQNNIKRAVAQGAPESEIIQWEHTYTQIQNGDMDPSGALTRSTINSEEVVRAALNEHRYNVLSDTRGPTLEPNTPQRFEFGPDATESVSEAARDLAAGLEIDDLMFHGSPVELYNTSYAAQLRPNSGMSGRSVEALSSTKTRKVKVKGKDGKVRTKTIKERGDLAAEDEWLGVNPVKTQVEAAQWQQTMAEKMGDLYTRALYPESYMPRAAFFLQARREVMRAMQSANPKMYTRMHDAVHAQEYEMIRMAEFFSKELNILGVYKKVRGTDVLQPDQSQRFFKLMNLDPSGDDYAKALSTLSETERRSIRRVRQELDFAKSKLGLEDTPLSIEGYIDHVFDPRWFDAGKRSPQWQGYSAKAEVFNRHMLPRAGNAGYAEDLALALDNYTRAFARKLHLEPLFEDMKFDAARWVRENPGHKWYADYVDDIINGMQGKPSTLGQRVDRDMAALNARMRTMASVNAVAKGVGKVQEKVVGPATQGAGERLAKIPGKIGKLGSAMESEGVRITEFGSTMALAGFPRYVTGDVSRTALGVSALSYTSVLGGSGRYFPMAIATGMVTTGSRFGVFESLRGILTMATPGGRKLAKQVGLEKQWVTIMDDAAWTKMGSLAANMPSFNGGTVLGPSIAATENTIRGWTFHASINDMIRKSEFKDWDAVKAAGMADKFAHEALRTTEEVNHLFGAFGKNPAMHSFTKSGNTAATQFLSFIPKQTEELLAQTLKNPGRIMQYMMLSGYLQRTAAKAGLDISEYVGMGFLPKTPDEATSIATETTVALLDHAFNMGKLVSGYGDKIATQRSGENLRRNLQNFYPFALATQRAGRGLETLRTGALFSNNRKIRDVDLGEFEWDSHKSIAENLSNLPAGFANGSDAEATEMLSVLSGMDSVAGTLEREQFMKQRKIAQDRVFRRSQLIDALDAAVKGENSQEFDRQLSIAIEEGMILPELTRSMNRATLELVLPRLMRMQLESDQKMLDALDEEQRAVQLYKFRFNR